MDKGLAGDSEKEALYVHIRPPQGGRAKGPRCGHSPRPPARAYGAPPRGACGPPAPLGCAPCAPFGARAPATCRPMRRGAVGCPPWVGNTRGQGLAAIPVFMVIFKKKRRRPGQLECVKRSAFCTRKASVSSVGNSRTRRAVHTLGVWAGELSMRGKGMNSAPAFAACEELKEGRTPL